MDRGEVFFFCALYMCAYLDVDGGGADLTQFKEGMAKVTSKISTVASSVMETFQVHTHILYVRILCTCTFTVFWV